MWRKSRWIYLNEMCCKLGIKLHLREGGLYVLILNADGEDEMMFENSQALFKCFKQLKLASKLDEWKENYRNFYWCTLLFQQNVRSVLVFSVASRPQRPYGLLGTDSPGRPPRLWHSSWTLPAERAVFSMLPHMSYLCRITGVRWRCRTTACSFNL